MTIASGVGKYVAVAKEATWGVKPAAGTSKYIRRVTFDLGLSREQFSSNEITSTAQTSSSRSGTDSVEGTLSGELSPGSYDDFFAALLRGPWVNGVTPAALTNVASSSVDNSLARAAGSWTGEISAQGPAYHRPGRVVGMSKIVDKGEYCGLGYVYHQQHDCDH